MTPTWYGVRRVFYDPYEGGLAYEERVAAWRAADEADATRLAEADAAEYCSDFSRTRDTGMTQLCRLQGEPDIGAVVFSRTRRSDLPAAQYLDRYFDVGNELTRRLGLDADLPEFHSRRVDDFSGHDWFTVRCVLVVRHRDHSVYEERMTLWQAKGFDRAIEAAETEVQNYALTTGAEYVGLAQGYCMFDEPGQGAEFFSLIRPSILTPEDYVRRFFDAAE